MITENRLTTYINSLAQGDGPLIETIAENAVKNRVPIIRRETASLLKTMVTLVAPNRILEVGTAVGYSALLMASVMPKECRITTIEKYEKRIPEAKENFRLAGMEEKITLLEGDAGEILAGLSGSFDFIFMDAAKGQYQAFLPHCLRLLPIGGLLIVDDVLQGGTIAQTRFSVPRRQRTIHKRLRNFLWEITHHDALETSIIPIGDGVALCYKKKEIIPETKTEGETKNAE